jgi:hypothetical protein
VNTPPTDAPRSQASIELEHLRDRQRKLVVHRDQIQADLRTAANDLAEAERALAKLEAQAAAGTVSAKERTEVERRLAEAKARRNEPWKQRFDGATAALRDADRELRLFAEEHIDELVADAEQAVEPLVARLNALTLELASTIAECHNMSRGIGEVLVTAGFRTTPSAITRMQTEQLARALDAFNLAGGQPEVRVERRFVPGLVARDEARAERATPVSAA